MLVLEVERGVADAPVNLDHRPLERRQVVVEGRAEWENHRMRDTYALVLLKVCSQIVTVGKTVGQVSQGLHARVGVNVEQFDASAKV